MRTIDLARRFTRQLLGRHYLQHGTVFHPIELSEADSRFLELRRQAREDLIEHHLKVTREHLVRPGRGKTRER